MCSSDLKLTGKRVFKMAPLHHHYEKEGMSETKIVVRFWIISVLLGGIALASTQFSNVSEVRANDGTPYFLGSGPALPAGGTLTMQLSNLPVHSSTPRYVGLALAGAVFALGAWLAFPGQSRDEDSRRTLAHRRDVLLGELAQLEQRRRADGLDTRAAARCGSNRPQRSSRRLRRGAA